MIPPPVPPVVDADRYAIYSLNADTSAIDVNFPIYGNQEDLTVTLNGSALGIGNWALVSKSGTPLAQIPLPITDGQVQFFPTIPAGSTVEIIGSFQPRQLTMPTAPGISRREFNQTVGALMSSLRELTRKTGITAAPVAMSFDAFGSLANRANYDAAAAGFVYLQTDDGSGRPIFFVKDSATSGDWSQALIVQAPEGTSGGEVPVGGLIDFTGFAPPTGYAFPFGQAYSRSSYSTLLLASTLTETGTLTSGSASVAGLTAASGMVNATDGLEAGMPVEGSGLPTGTTIQSVDSSTAITLSANATASGAKSLTFFPYGNGDGSTTFNVIDRRGRVSFGRDNMGGTAASRITTDGSGINGGGLGATGGAETHIIALDELPAHNHTVSVSDPGHAHPYNQSEVTGGSTFGGAGAAYKTVDTAESTGNATTGISATTADAGSGDAHQNMPPGAVLNVILRIQ